MRSDTVIEYNINIIKGIIKEIFFVIKSAIKIKNKKIGTLIAVNDNIVGLKLQGPNIKFPFQRI